MCMSLQSEVVSTFSSTKNIGFRNIKIVQVREAHGCVHIQCMGRRGVVYSNMYMYVYVNILHVYTCTHIHLRVVTLCSLA